MVSWLQLHFQTTPAIADSLSQALEAVGALSVSLQDAADQPIYEPPLNTTPLWGKTVVTGLFTTDKDIQQMTEQLSELLAPQPLPPFQQQLIADQDWQRVWMQDFQPMQFGERLWICPSWHSPPAAEAVNILLDPGLAFGTGTHTTTALCLEWLDQHAPFTGQTWLDYGCGSGILAIALVKLGAQYVYCVDNDPQALLATQENAEKNQVSNYIQTFLPEQFPDLQVDGLMANILATPLRILAPTFAEYLKPAAAVILSGIISEQIPALVAAYETFFTITEIKERDDWVRIVVHRR